MLVKILGNKLFRKVVLRKVLKDMLIDNVICPLSSAGQEHPAVNRKVAGSIPVEDVIFFKNIIFKKYFFINLILNNYL